MHLVKETELFVPTTKDLLEIPDPPDPQSPGYEHFKCYRSTTEGPFPRDLIVELEDQFGFQKAVVRRPVRFCAPVDKNGEAIHDPVRHLTCYGLKPLVRWKAPIASVFTRNQFRPEFLDVLRVKELCVPGVKTAVTYP
jgi:hypothetical protein